MEMGENRGDYDSAEDEKEYGESEATGTAAGLRSDWTKKGFR